MLTLTDRQEMIYRWIPLGSSLEECFIVAECTDAECELLRRDKAFLRKVEVYRLKEEMRLLAIQRNAAVKIAKEKGNTAGVQWKLERLNPAKWGKSYTAEEEIKGSGLTINLKMMDRAELKNMDGIEIHDEGK